MNDYEYNDMDSGIDWSSVTLPGEEINHSHSSNNNNQQQPCANSTIVVAQHSNNVTDPVNSNWRSDANSRISTSFSQQQQHQHEGDTAVSSIMDNAPLHLLQRGDNHGNSQEVITIDGNDDAEMINNPNVVIANPRTTHDPIGIDQSQQLLEQIQKLQALLAEKDSKLFDLESTMATVEAESSFQIKQNQHQLDQQLRASQDTVRQLEKDVDSKNHVIVKLRKRNRQSMSGSHTASTPNINANPDPNANSNNDHGYPSNGIGVGMDISMNGPQSPMSKRISNRDAAVSYQNHLPTADVANTALYPPRPTLISFNGQGRPTMQNRTPPLSKDHYHNLTTAENRFDVNYNDAQNETSAIDATSIDNAANENDIEMKDVHSQYGFEAVIQSWKDEKYNEVMIIVMHLIRYNERFLPTSLPYQKSDLDPDCDTVEVEGSVGAGDEGWSRGAARGIARQNMKAHSDIEKTRTLRNEYAYALRMQSMLLHVLEWHNRPQHSLSDRDKMACRVSVESSRNNYTPDIDYVAKELINMIASMEKMPLESMVLNVVNSPHGPIPCLSVLVELCSVSAAARRGVRSWICRRKESDTAAKNSNRIHSKNDIMRIRGLPEKYRKHVQKLYSGNNGCDSDTGDTHECNLVCASFLDTLLRWICGPEPKQYQMMSRQERIHVRMIQVQSMKFLNLLILDAPQDYYLQLHGAIFRDVKEGDTSYDGTDVISVLERSTVLTMIRCGHRHALIQQQWKEAILSSFVETSDFPNGLLVKVKTQIVRLLAVFYRCPRLLDAVGHSSKSPRHHSNVSNLKRMVAALLDDLQSVVLPAISRPCPDETSSLAVYQYGASAIQLLTVLSKSLEGFTMVRTQIREGDLEKDESRISETSIIAVVADILEISIHAIQLELSTKAVGEHNIFEHLRLQSLLLLVARAVHFFHSIQCQCLDHGGSQLGSKKVKVHLSGILADAERSRSFFISCQKVATLMPQMQSLDGYQNTVEPDVKVKARSMMQLLDVE